MWGCNKYNETLQHETPQCNIQFAFNLKTWLIMLVLVSVAFFKTFVFCVLWIASERRVSKRASLWTKYLILLAYGECNYLRDQQNQVLQATSQATTYRKTRVVTSRFRQDTSWLTTLFYAKHWFRRYKFKAPQRVSLLLNINDVISSHLIEKMRHANSCNFISHINLDALFLSEILLH